MSIRLYLMHVFLCQRRYVTLCYDWRKNLLCIGLCGASRFWER